MTGQLDRTNSLLHNKLIDRFVRVIWRPVKDGISSRWPLFVLVLIVTVLYSSLSILRHRHFGSGAYDLGIFDQAVWQYSSFRLPYDSVRSNLLTENLLGDHFHPVLMLLAPLYWVVDNVEALLLAQALLLAFAIVPIFLFTEKRLGKAPAYLFAGAYALFWAIQNAVEFDFHEVAFAVPLIALAIYFTDLKNWMGYFVCIGLLLLTKENLAVTVIFFGLYLIVTKEFKIGLASVAAGLIWFVAAVKIFIPFFIDPNTVRADRPANFYRYWSYNQFGPNPLSAIWTMIKKPWLVLSAFFQSAVKLHTLWYLFHPFLFLAILSPLLILAIPMIAERFLSEGAHFWGTDFHYSATITPVIAMASADGLARVGRLTNATNARRLFLAASVLIVGVNLYLLPRFPLWRLTSPAYWTYSSSDIVGREALSLIPADVSVSAQAPITPHLSHRREIYVLNPLTSIPDAEFIIASEGLSSFPFPKFGDIRHYVEYQRARGYQSVFERQGWIVLKRGAVTGKPPAIYNDAAFVKQAIPTTMTAGQTYDVQVTMRNVGISPWTADSYYRLAIINSRRDWGIERVELPASVTASSTVTFDFKVTAPSRAGAYSFRCGMVQEGVIFFGESTPEVSVNVQSATTSAQ